MQRPGHPCIATFYALTIAVSWSCWAASAMAGAAEPVLKIAGTFGPAIAALVLVWPDPAARRALLVARALTGTGPISPGPMPFWLPFAVFGYVLVFSVAGEELGWRGYALPGLIGRHGPVAASLALGGLWAVWHAPLFVLPGDFHQGIPAVLFAFQIVASSFVYTHLHMASGGSLIPAHLFHAGFNTAVGLFPVLPAARGGDATALAVAVAILSVVALATGALLHKGGR